jgi:hypothetical protein
VTADLGKRCVSDRFNEIVGGIDLERLWPFPTDLTCKDVPRSEGVTGWRQRFTIDFLHLVDGPPTMQAARNIDLVANKSSYADLPLIFSNQADLQPSG